MKGGIASVVSKYKIYIGKDFRHFSTIDYSNNSLNLLFFVLKKFYVILFHVIFGLIKNVLNNFIMSIFRPSTTSRGR